MAGATATMKPPSKAAASVGSALMANPAVSAAVDSIVREVRTASAKVTGVHGPIEGLKEGYESYLKRAAEVRGRGLYYPYLGSGVGNGALVELADGSVKWDMICGIGVQFFGHSEPGLIEAALRGSIEDALKQGNLSGNLSAYDFCETLMAEARKGSRLRHCYVGTSGTMANENALKVCMQKHTPADRVIAFQDCFMGRSLTMSSIGDSAANRVGIPINIHVDYMPFYDPAAAAAMGKAKHIDAAVRRLREYVERYPKRHACFIFEMVQGEGGFNVGDRDFFKALMEVCRASNIAIWADEIQTFGRLPSMFAYDHFGLGEYVDVLCVGKMTQSCVTAFTEAYNPGPGLLSGTFLGEGPSFRVGQHVIERLRDGGYYGPTGRIARQHAAFRKHAEALIARRPEWFPRVESLTELVSGLGGMMRLTPFGGDKERVIKACRACFDEGVVLFYCGHGPYHIRMLPPLGVMEESQWPDVFACLERGLAKA